jgi:hypothetical protein
LRVDFYFGCFKLVALRVGGRMIKFGKSERLWRPLIGIVVAYAVAAQSLLIAIGGFQLIARADSTPAFELCVHDAQGAPPPADVPSHPGCSHCIFCFAGSHHAVIGSPPVLFQRVDVATIDGVRLAVAQIPPRLPAHSIASPRGPPLRA